MAKRRDNVSFARTGQWTEIYTREDTLTKKEYGILKEEVRVATNHRFYNLKNELCPSTPFLILINESPELDGFQDPQKDISRFFAHVEHESLESSVYKTPPKWGNIMKSLP